MEEKSQAIAWNWVIEALARSDVVDPAILYELCPRISGDTDSAIAAQEAVALRCLEDLYPSSQHHDLDPQLGPHPVESCQHKLQRVLLETDNLQKDASDDLKRSVRTFVNHKKAQFPKCTLELLKDTIEQGNPSVFKENSEHVFGDQCGLDVPSAKYGHPMHPQATNVKIPLPSETLCPQINTCNPASEINDLLRNVKICNTSSGQSKTGINGSCIAPPTKKLNLQNQCGMPPKQQDSVSSDVAEFPDDIEDESYNPLNEAKQTRGEEPSEEIVAPDHFPQQSSGKSAAISRAVFSGSQSVFSQDPVTLIDTQANICMKCNKGGRLLSCCGSTCPLRFHETCLGCFVGFDDRGDFYCPMCAYSRAVADFVKAEERVSRARKELTLFIGGPLQDDADAIKVAGSH